MSSYIEGKISHLICTFENRYWKTSRFHELLCSHSLHYIWCHLAKVTHNLVPYFTQHVLILCLFVLGNKTAWCFACLLPLNHTCLLLKEKSPFFLMLFCKTFAITFAISKLFPFSSATQLCPTLCDPMNHSTPGLPVHYQLPESTQIHVHWVGDAIQPSHPLSSPSPPALNLS